MLFGRHRPCHELMGHRRRCRLLDLDRLCWRLGGDLAQVRQQLEFGIQDRLVRDELRRIEYWSRSLAVGSRSFLERTQELIFSRAETEIVEWSRDICVLREDLPPYTVKSATKIVPKGLTTP